MDVEKFDRIYIRVSVKEKEDFKQAAHQAGCTLSELMRQACREKIVKEQLTNGRK